jgi:hypothetical protein
MLPRKTLTGAPQNEAAPARLHLSPPKRLFGLVDNVAAGNPDVVQVALAPLRQFLPVPDPFTPGVDRFLDLGPKT